MKQDARRGLKLNLVEQLIKILYTASFIQIGSKIWLLFEFETFKWPPFLNNDETDQQIRLRSLSDLFVR